MIKILKNSLAVAVSTLVIIVATATQSQANIALASADLASASDAHLASERNGSASESHLTEGASPAQESVVKAPPNGVYHSAGSVKSANQRALVNSNINGQDYVSGTLVRMNWSLINPSEGVFDFTLIERELEQAILYDSSITLAVIDSKSMPQFVLDKCETFDYKLKGKPEQTCLPWDTDYLRYKRELVSRLGAQFDSHPNLAGVYFTYSAMANGIEMHFNVDEVAFTEAGYTSSRLSDTYNVVMDMYADAFATTSIIMEIHEVFREAYLAESAFEHCYDILGSRCGVAIWWCASRIATVPKQSGYKVYPIAQQATELSFAICQSIGSFTDQPHRFDQGQGWTTLEAFNNEMDFFVGEGFQVFEYWSQDLKNEVLIDRIIEDVVPNL